MYGSVCECIYKQFINTHVTTLWVVLDFIFTLIVIVIGLIVTCRFRQKLKEEKRTVLPGRKGNVIEPIMRWYLVFTIFYWPYSMICYWIMHNEFVPSSWLNNCWLLNLTLQPIKIGRLIIAYNSFFVSLIRYLYIVHPTKSNQWDFQKTARIFQVGSIVLPIALDAILLVTGDYPWRNNPSDSFKECVAVTEGLNSTTSFILPEPVVSGLVSQVVPRELMTTINVFCSILTLLIGSNTVEGYFYFKMFQSAKRLVTA